MLHISMLGPLQVTIDGTPANFRTDAQRVLLAYLAAHQGVPQRRETLAFLLSPDRPDNEAFTYLRNRLTRLRGSLFDSAATPPWLAIDRKQIALRAGDDIVIDLTHFEQGLTTAEDHAHRQLAGCPACMTQLQAAVELVRGDFLAGLNFPSETWEAWLVTQRAHIQQRALDAMTLLRDARLARQEWEMALDVAQRQLTLEPWLEAAHRAAMTAHHRLGDRNAALAQYEQCTQLLWTELGVEPEEETRRLRQHIFDGTLAEQDESHARDNLPHQTNRFVGRGQEEAQILQRLVDPSCRLLTLVGTGGSGKTRLAIEVGAQAKTNFPDGVWLVPLEAVKGGSEQIKIAVGEAAGLGHGDRQLTGDQVLAILRDKRMLLILDNCETVLDELGFVAGWLKRAPDMAILATSREPLLLGAESVILLDGLAIGADGVAPEKMGAAEALFAAQAQMARDGFAVSAANLPQVRRICRLVDGLPLGITLAAAWVRRRSLAQIVDAIDQSLDFLSTRQRDVDPRHRSMRAVFETSWQLLSAAEQAVLAALALFPASFSASAAAVVGNATLADLDLLCEKSLLQQGQEQERYTMHSLLRQFAGERLETRIGEVERAFVDYFHAYACDHRDSYALLQPEWANFSTAIAKAHSLAAWQTVLDFVQELDEPWFRQVRFSEMRAGLTLALDAATSLEDPSALARTLLRLGEIEMELNEYAAAEGHLAAARRHAMHREDGLEIAQAQYLLGRIKNEQAQDGEALQLFEDSRRIFEDEADSLGIAKNLNLIAVCHVKQHRDFQTAFG